VNKALAKDRELRYQSAKDLLVELKGLRLELELSDKIKQTGQPGQAATPIEAGERQPMLADAINTLMLSPPPPAGDAHTRLELVGGAMPLNSGFYIVRGADEEFRRPGAGRPQRAFKQRPFSGLLARRETAGGRGH